MWLKGKKCQHAHCTRQCDSSKEGEGRPLGLSRVLFGSNGLLWNGVGLLLGHSFGSSFVHFDLISLIKFFLFHFFSLLLFYVSHLHCVICSLLIFLFIELTKNSKQESPLQSVVRCFFSYFGMNEITLCVFLLSYMC